VTTESAGRTRSEKVSSPSMLVARSVWLEMLRREEHSAVFILMGLYLVAAIGARLVGGTRPEAVALMLNMGLWLSAALAAVLTLLNGARLIPNEVEARTLYPLLAKPIRRREVVLGKCFAATAAGCAVFILFTLLTTLTWTAAFPLPGQDLLMFGQAIVLQALALLLLCSLTVFSSLLLPKAVTVLLVGFLYFGGTPTLNLIRSALRDTAFYQAVDWVLWYVPDFSRLCLLQRFTDGASPLGSLEWLALFGYGAVFSFVFLALSTFIFEKRSL
jgi:ABC-type transport system involved in multi-copper enzyme maturation permease subunit